MEKRLICSCGADLKRAKLPVYIIYGDYGLECPVCGKGHFIKVTKEGIDFKKNQGE